LLRIEFQIEERLFSLEASSNSATISVYEGAELVAASDVELGGGAHGTQIFLSDKNAIFSLSNHATVQSLGNKLERLNSIPSDRKLFFGTSEFENSRRDYWRKMLAREDDRR